MIKKTVTFFALGSALLAQTPEFKITGFVDAFYSYDHNDPATSKRQEFLFNHNRHNEFNVNLALLKMSVDESKYRANIALQAGTYAQDNYPDNYENLNEANVGVSLNADNSLWFDAGIFTSHLGFESAISMDNYTLTRSLAAESSPYYLTGAKLTYKASSELEMAFILSNGWQTIEKEDPNTQLSIGTQLVYTPDERTTLNWSTFIGEADELDRRLRIFNNLYGEFLLNEELSIIAGFDIGALESVRGSDNYDIWHISSLLAKYRLDTQSAVGLRAEYVNDTSGAILGGDGLGGNGFGMNTFGASANYDYYPQKNIALRTEARYLRDADDAYKENKDNTLFLTVSVALKF